MAHMHGVLIHDPGHDLFVCVDVRAEDIFFRTQDLNELRSVPAGESLQFTLGHLVWIADHPTSCAAERPLAGPRSIECCTLNPVNVSRVPSSICTGTCTMTS